MNLKNIIQKLILALSSLGLNAIPIAAFFYNDNSASTALALYILETLVGVGLVSLFVHLRAPTDDPGYREIASTRMVVSTNGRVSRSYQAGNRRSLLQGFLIFSLGFGLIPGVFMVLFLSAILKVDLSLAVLLPSLGGMILFQLINFGIDLYKNPGIDPQTANNIINANMGRSVILFISCYIGAFLAAFVRGWFILPFAILKTIVDVGSVFRK